MDYARYAEEKASAVWQAESRLVRDAIVPMAAFAAVTERIQVARRHQQLDAQHRPLAATFLTLDDLAPNLLICGIGVVDPLARNVGIERRKPLTAMRETIEVMRRLLALENVTYHGEFHHVDGVELDVVHGCRELPYPHYDRRHRPQDDGTGRRDRRRRGAQLLRAAGVQHRGDGTT